MHRIRNFLSIDYYISILSGQQQFRTFSVIFILALLLSISPSITIIRTAYPFARNMEEKVITLVEEIYPAELEITIKNGLSSTNVTEPYYITIKKETLERFLSDTDNENTSSNVRILAIDTKGRAENFERHQSFALLTEASFVYYNEGNINIYPLREVPNITVTQNLIKSKIQGLNKNNTLGRIVSAVILASPVFVLFGIYLGLLFILLFTSLFVYIIIKIHKLNIGFKKTLHYTVAIAFIPTLIQNLLTYIPRYWELLGFVDSLFHLFILGLAYYGIIHLKSKKTNYA